MIDQTQIFTRLQKQEVPVDSQMLADIQYELMSEASMKDVALATKQVEIHGYPFTVEVAETSKQKAKGLSGRKHIPSGTGMLFKMSGGPAKFHMRNTHFPLDILYLDGGGVVIMKDRMHPYSGKSHCDGDVHSVLELPVGTSDELSIEVGDLFDLQDDSFLRNVVREVLYRFDND